MVGTKPSLGPPSKSISTWLHMVSLQRPDSTEDSSSIKHIEVHWIKVQIYSQHLHVTAHRQPLIGTAQNSVLLILQGLLLALAWNRWPGSKTEIYSFLLHNWSAHTQLQVKNAYLLITCPAPTAKRMQVKASIAGSSQVSTARQLLSTHPKFTSPKLQNQMKCLPPQHIWAEEQHQLSQ